MKIMHVTHLETNCLFNVVEYDEALNDDIWVRIYWWLITRDIDLVVDEGRRVYATLHSTELPYPNVAAGNFIPFDEVTDRDMLRWIHEAEGKKNIIQKQRDNLAGFIKKYNLHDQWKGTI